MTERPDLDLIAEQGCGAWQSARLAEYALSLEARLKEQGEALVAYAAVNECPGVLVEPGITSGCRAYATGLDDCPTCRALSADTEARNG